MSTTNNPTNGRTPDPETTTDDHGALTTRATTNGPTDTPTTSTTSTVDDGAPKRTYKQFSATRRELINVNELYKLVVAIHEKQPPAHLQGEQKKPQRKALVDMWQELRDLPTTAGGEMVEVYVDYYRSVDEKGKPYGREYASRCVHVPKGVPKRWKISLQSMDRVTRMLLAFQPCAEVDSVNDQPSGLLDLLQIIGEDVTEYQGLDATTRSNRRV